MEKIEITARAVAGFLGMRRDYALVLVTVVLVSMGERIGSRFLPKYLEVLGAGAIVIGLYGAFENLFGALWALPGGIISDRLGVKKALAVFNVIAMVGYATVIAVPRWQAVLLGAVLFMSWSSLSLPATMSLVADILPPTKRIMGISMHSIIRRIPMAVGPVLGGVLIGAYGIAGGVRLAFVIAIVMSLVGLLVQQRMVSGAPAPYEPMRLSDIVRHFRPQLRHLLLSDILIRFCEQIPNAFVVLWVMNVVGRKAIEFGWLTALEMGTAMLLYIPVAHFADKTERKPFVIATFGFFTLFPAILFFSRGVGMLAVAFIVRGLKEFGEPSRKAMIVDLAEADLKARTVGAYYLIRDSIVSVAALLGGVLWNVSPASNLWVAFACGLVGTLVFALKGQGVSVRKVSAC